MLEMLRKQMRGILIITIFLIIPSFVIFYGARGAGRRTEARHAGEIYGRKVPVDEYNRYLYWAHVEGRMRYGDQFEHIKQFLDLEHEAWMNLVLHEAARRGGISISDDELFFHITSMPVFAGREGNFDRNLYRNVIAHGLGMTPQQFEDYMRRMLTVEKLRDSVTDGIRVSEAEIKSFYRRYNETARVEYVKFEIDDFIGMAEISGQMLESYFSRNPETFRMPETRRIEYIAFPADAESESISAAEKRAYYDANLSRFSYEEETGEGETEARYEPFEDVREEIRDILARRRAAGKARRQAEETILDIEEGFAYWEDFEPAETDYVPAGSGSPHPSVVREAFRTEQGGIGPAVETREAFYVFKTAGVKPGYIPDSYEHVRERVLERVKREEARKLASLKADEFLEHLKDSDGFHDSASFFGLEIIEPGGVRRDGFVQGLGRAPEFAEASFGLSASSPFAKAPVPGGTAVINFIEREPIDEEKFSREREMYKSHVKSEKQERVLQDWFILLQEETGADFFL